jgi:hypothetical protein
MELLGEVRLVILTDDRPYRTDCRDGQTEKEDASASTVSG